MHTHTSVFPEPKHAHVCMCVLSIHTPLFVHNDMYICKVEALKLGAFADAVVAGGLFAISGLEISLVSHQFAPMCVPSNVIESKLAHGMCVH